MSAPADVCAGANARCAAASASAPASPAPLPEEAEAEELASVWTFKRSKHFPIKLSRDRDMLKSARKFTNWA